MLHPGHEAVARPLRPLAPWSVSGGNVAVSRPSASDSPERLLPDPLYSRTRPNAVIGRLKGPRADYPVQQSFQPTANRRVVGLMGLPVDAEKYLSQPA